LALTAAAAAAAQWLVLPQPAAARGASSQKVDPQLLAAFQEALSDNSYEVNSIAGLTDAYILISSFARVAQLSSINQAAAPTACWHNSTGHKCR
jgi:hypothetical protein